MMFPIGFSASRKLLSAAFAVATISLLSTHVARADNFVYVFSGSASGSIVGATTTTFSNAAFTLTINEPTSAIDNRGGGYYSYDDVNAAFSEGAFTATLTNVTLEVNGSSGFQNVDFYNLAFSNGLGIADVTPVGYALATNLVVPVSGSNLTPTFGGGSFTTTGTQTVQFTGDSTLGFTATDLTTAVPEPSTLLLLVTGLSGIGLLRRRFCA